KRDYGNQENFSSSGSSSSSGKVKAADEDELFAVLGYSVRSSDMEDVAQKIQKLEEAMGGKDGLSQLSSSETVHYNPSDLSSWLESMISELNPPDPFLDSSTADNRAGTAVDLDFGSDLISIPGKAVYPSPQGKKAKTTSCSGNHPAAAEPPTRSLLVDSQENGIRLVHTLMACAEAVQQEDYKLAEALVKNVGFLTVSQAGAMRKVAAYFAEALTRRIYRCSYPAAFAADNNLLIHFYEACPYLKFAHFTANQAILEAFAGKDRVHVIDFGVKQGMQWPALLHALALRPGGPPTFRLTGIGPPSREVGWRLSELADTVHVEFDYKDTVTDSLADLDIAMLDIREGETLAVNSVFELHPLLAKPPAEIGRVLQLVRELKPEIFTVVEQEANLSGNFFLDRFTEALHYYSAIFDSLESCGGAASGEDKMMSEVYLGRQICNVVSCEGADRFERYETLERWKRRLGRAGFQPVRLGSNVYKQAILLLALFAGGDGYRVEENDGCLMLGWHTRPIIATSAWKLS
ncbi:hypothetical protein M569_16090, partial [Genlisea aurea]